MYQEIVFCKSIFEKIVWQFKNEEPWDADTYRKNLQLKKIITFPGNKKIIEKSLNQSEGFLKIFGNHIFTANKINYLTTNEQNKFHKDININSLLSLADASESKILHSELKRIQDLANEILPSGIEITNISQFNNPQSFSRLLVVNRNIDISKGKTFRFDSILLDYFKHSTSITFSDKYIRKRKSAYVNLKRFIRMCSNLQNISIYTDTREINDCFIKVDELKNELMDEFNINPNIFPTSHHRRKIKTDKFELKIDPGLDFVNEEYKAEKHHVDIQIKMLNT